MQWQGGFTHVHRGLTHLAVMYTWGFWLPEREIEKSIVLLHAKPSDDWFYLFLNSICEVMVRPFPFLNAAAYLYSMWTTLAQSRNMPDRIHYSADQHYQTSVNQPV